jgi:integrase/recombinase XerD
VEEGHLAERDGRKRLGIVSQIVSGPLALTSDMTRLRHPSPSRDSLEAAVIDLWRLEGYTAATISGYLRSIRAFRLHCHHRQLDESAALTQRRVIAIAACVARKCGRAVYWAVRAAKTGLRRWAVALVSLGVAVPPWRPRRAHRCDALLAEYCEFRRRWRSVKQSSLVTETGKIKRFLSWLPSRRRLSSVTPECIDDFLTSYGKTVRPKTLASMCCGLRAFLRFLHATGRSRLDLARCVQGPWLRSNANPPRALRWDDVRRTLALIDRTTRTGKRDYAMFLLMVTYGMGASDALALCLDDIDWQEGTIRLVRPKTGTLTILPLLGGVGKAIAAYLRATPRPKARRSLFLQTFAPFAPLAYSGLAIRWQQYTAAAGVSFQGTHALRHTHASRQVEAAAPPKVVSDILGHADPRSLSTYARVATERLRAVCLPVP